VHWGPSGATADLGGGRQAGGVGLEGWVSGVQPNRGKPDRPVVTRVWRVAQEASAQTGQLPAACWLGDMQLAVFQLQGAPQVDEWLAGAEEGVAYV
jgi:hypothetical protein